MNLRKWINKYARTLKYGSNAVILIAIVVALAVFLNMLVGLMDIKWDLTPNKIFSVSSTTEELLAGLEEDVEIISLNDEAVLASNADYKKVVEILENYRSPRIKISYVDPDKDLSVISNLDPDGMYKITKTNFVVKSGNRIKVIASSELIASDYNYYTGESTVTGINAEQVFTGAIKYVTADEIPKIYFLTGHDEISVDSQFTSIKNYITRNNFDVAALNLITEGKIPEDCSILVVLSPQRDLASAEREILKDYIRNGGANILFMFDPISTEARFTNFDNILLDYNISLGYDQIMEGDSGSYLPGNQQFLYLPFQTNSIMPAGTSSSARILMPMTRSINILRNTKEYLTTSAIIKTSDKAIAKSAIDGTEQTGPFNTAVLAEYTGGYSPSKLLVIGNSVFTSDSLLNPSSAYYNYNGGMFVVYSLNYMKNIADSSVVVPTKSYESRSIDISQSTAQTLGISVVVIFPLLILGAGLFVWLRRRHL